MGGVVFSKPAGAAAAATDAAAEVAARAAAKAQAQAARAAAEAAVAAAKRAASPNCVARVGEIGFFSLTYGESQELKAAMKAVRHAHSQS